MSVENSTIIKRLAIEIKKVFIKKKTEEAGRPYKLAPRFNQWETWKKIAENCEKLKVTPEQFVEAAFQYNNVPGGPFPNTLASENYMEKVVQNFKHQTGYADTDDETSEERCMLSYKVGLTILQNIEKNTKMSKEKILMLDSVQIVPWVKLLLSEFDYDVINKYYDLIEYEIAKSPLIRDIVKKRDTQNIFKLN